MNSSALNTFLRDWTYGAKYQFLEEATDSLELQRVAEMSGIVLPARDLAIFKCIYAFVDKPNLNGATLPREEVEKALPTLKGKAIDFDHVRGRIVGHWLFAELVPGSQTIVAYGAFFKGNLPEDYELLKSLMEDGILAISMEAYVTREYTSLFSYVCTNIEFSGGALLIKTKPAFPGAKVLDMANTRTEKVLEFASQMTAPEDFVKEIDKSEESLEESAKWTTKYINSLPNSSFAVIEPAYLKGETKDKNARHLPFKDANGKVDLPHYRNALARANQIVPVTDSISTEELRAKAKATLEKYRHVLKTEKSEVDQASKNTEKEDRLDMDEKEKKVQEQMEDEVKDQEVKDLPEASPAVEDEKPAEEEQKEEVKEGEVKDEAKEEDKKDEAKQEESSEAIEELKQQLVEKDKELAKLQEEIKVLQESLDKEVAKAREQAEELFKRKASLGEKAKDMSDEDILDDKLYKIAMLEKENEELKKFQKEKSNLEVGSAKKDDSDPLLERQKKIRELAFGQ